jgi:heterodisulfide reductase subunit A
MYQLNQKDNCMNADDPPRVGIFVCECGEEIAGILDTEALRQRASDLPGVVYAASESYPCSKDGRLRIQQAIKAHNIERVLIAGCTPRLMNKLFEKTMQSVNLERSYLDVRNIREHCAYVHSSEPGVAQQKAANLIEMGVKRLAVVHPPHPYTGRMVKSVLVIGSGLSGLTAALTLADAGISVTLIEESETLGGELQVLQDHAREMIAEKIKETTQSSSIHVMIGAHLTEVIGQPGDYQVSITQNDKITTNVVGAIVVATGAQWKTLDRDGWYDLTRVKTLAEFTTELDNGSFPSGNQAPQNIVMILYGEEAGGERYPQLNSIACIHQAIYTKQLEPNTNVTILFRDLHLGGVGEQGMDDFLQAKELGVTFFRYQEAHPPIISDETIDIQDVLTGDSLSIPFDQAVLAMPLIPQEGADTLAALLRLPQDENGFIVESRVRLRPGYYVDDGIFVLGGAHLPADTPQTLLQAYVTSARVQRFLDQEKISIEAPIAEIDASLCTGCGNCTQVCPMTAITLEKRDGILSLSAVNPLRCTGCGNCVVVCPVKAITMPGWNDAAIMEQITTALNPSPLTLDTNGKPRIVALTCEWSAYAAADMAGAQRLSYPPNIRIIRMNCSARFDPNLILWAFLNRADGVFLGACHPGDCHYGSGNLYAKERVEALKTQLAEHGFNPNRLHMEFISGNNGAGFAHAVKKFVELV